MDTGLAAQREAWMIFDADADTDANVNVNVSVDVDVNAVLAPASSDS
jgi:hypothetical protein